MRACQDTIRDTTLTGHIVNKTAPGVSLESRGGGINVDVLTLDNGIISGNSAQHHGRRITAAIPTISNSTITANTGSTSNGGGILAETDTIVISSISNNTAVKPDGGVRSDESLRVENSTI